MNPVSQVLSSLLTSSTLSVRFTRAAAFAGAMLLQAQQEGRPVPWSAVGVIFLAGMLGAGEPNSK